MEPQEEETLVVQDDDDDAATTETHKLIQTKEWNAVNKRLATAEGKTDATLKDAEGRLIFHLDELCDPEVPIQTLRLAHDANPNGFMEPVSKRRSNDDGTTTYVTYPVFLAIRRSRQDVVSFLLHLHPNSAKMEEEYEGNLPLHVACEEGNNAATQLLLSVYPAGASKKNNDSLYPLLLSKKCSLEVKFSVLAAFPSIVTEKIPYSYSTSEDITRYYKTLLQFVVDEFDEYRIIESILHRSPAALMQRDCYGDLPIHCGMKAESVMTIELLDLISQGDPNVLKEKGHDGMLPLHQLCRDFGRYEIDSNREASERVIKLFREVLRRYPEAAHAMDDKYRLPLDHMLYNLAAYEEITPAFKEIWCSLVEIAPESLCQRNQEENPFVELSRLIQQPPIEFWYKAAIYQPAAFRALDEEKEGAALSFSLYDRKQEELLDSSSYSVTILELSFRCLRNAYFLIEKRTRRAFIQEDVPVMHMLAYCFHLLGIDTIERYLMPIVEDGNLDHMIGQSDSRGNTVVHTLFSAPCPKEKNDVQMKHPDAVRATLLDFINNLCIDNDSWGMISVRNVFGDMPIHLLLRNRHPILHSFNLLIDELVEQDVTCALLVDSTETLYPFMLAALNLAGRKEKAEVCSLTFTLLRHFVTVNDMTIFCEKNKWK